MSSPFFSLRRPAPFHQSGFSLLTRNASPLLFSPQCSERSHWALCLLKNLLMMWLQFTARVYKPRLPHVKSQNSYEMRRQQRKIRTAALTLYSLEVSYRSKQNDKLRADTILPAAFSTTHPLRGRRTLQRSTRSSCGYGLQGTASVQSALQTHRVHWRLGCLKSTLSSAQETLFNSHRFSDSNRSDSSPDPLLKTSASNMDSCA